VTIEVYGQHVVRANQSLSFHNEAAFYLKSHGDLQEPPRLVNRGSVTVTFDGESMMGTTAILTDHLAADFLIWNVEGAELHVSSSAPYGSVRGIAAGTQGTVRNDGLISVEMDDGDAHGAAVSSFINNGTFSVSGGGQAVGVGSAQEFTNHGAVTVTGGVGAWGVLSLGDFRNAGALTVRGGAENTIAMLSSSQGHYANEGSIRAISSDPARPSHGLLLTGSGNQRAEIVNSGLIEADRAVWEQSYYPGSPQGFRTTLTNSGKILGDVDLGFENDVAVNSGLVAGDLNLGGDHDSYAASGRGKVRGLLIGGGGQDTISGARADDVIWGDFGDPKVKAGGLDRLSGGKGDDQLNGEAGADTLTGGEGRDRLDGGLGDDVYVFTAVSDSRGTRIDTIATLEAGDRIDLSLIDADALAAGDQAFAFVAAFDGHAGQALLRYHEGSDTTRLYLDVDGDRRPDATIVILGEHADFSGFVL
jgi:Ca2+-binding RTX toxin-like protein